MIRRRIKFTLESIGILVVMLSIAATMAYTIDYKKHMDTPAVSAPVLDHKQKMASPIPERKIK